MHYFICKTTNLQDIIDSTTYILVIFMDTYSIAIASDHHGHALKCKLIEHLKNSGHNMIDLGPHEEKVVDYPDYADMVCEHILDKGSVYGVLICATGIGMSIAANRYSGIRAALATNVLMSERARLHNDANILVLGATIVDDDTSIAIADKFFLTNFEGGRHTKRLEKIS